MLCVRAHANCDNSQLNNSATGTHDGYYYSFWKDAPGQVIVNCKQNGRYQVSWSDDINNWVGGKGWNPGGRKTIRYSGTYLPNNNANSYLAVYGWTKNPLIEYYIVESYGSYKPSTGGKPYGSFTSDGATYDVYRQQRVQQPSINGTQTFFQYFSVRRNKKPHGKINGTVTTGNHFDYWASKGLKLGDHDYMIVATEGNTSGGKTDITVSEIN